MPLPPGLALNPLTGQISGVPTTPGTYNFTLRVRDSQGSQRDIPQSITVTAYTPPALSGTLAGFANRTVAYSSGLSVSGGVAPFVWSIASGTLPTGMSINTSTGVISGTPTDTNYTDRTITVRVVDANNSAAQSTQTIRYADVLALTGSLNAGTQGSAYSDGFDRSGGHSPFTYAITSGSLPPGLSIDTSTGIISGTPTTITSVSLTIRVTDANGTQQSRSGTLNINSSYVPVDIVGSVGSTTQNVEELSAFSITPDYSGVSVNGGSGTITYSWARISGSTSISAGAPSSLGTSFIGNCAPGSSVSATFRLTATDGTSSDTLDVTITVNNVYVTLSASASSLPLSTRSVAYSSSVSRTGGKSPFNFTVISGTLPTGISLNASTGALTGTPTDTGYTTRSLTFRVTDALGASVDASGSIVYRNLPSFLYSLGGAMRTRAYSAGANVAADSHGFGSMAITSGTLPTGLSLNSSTGVISGTPTDTSYTTRSINFQFTDAAGNVAAQTAAQLAYADNLSISGTLPAGTAGTAYSSSALSASGGHGSNVWSIASGSLPAGLSINSATGAVTGTPSAAGSFSFTVRVTDARGFTADSAQSVTIAAALTVSVNNTTPYGGVTNSPPSFNPPTALVITFPETVATPSGGTPPYSYSWSRISGSTAITAGSPTSATTTFSGTIQIGTASAVFRLTVTDSASRQATIDVTPTLVYESGF